MNYFQNADYSWSEDSLRYIHTPSQKTQELFYYIQEIGHFKAFPPYFTERAGLPSYLMKFTLKGQGELTYHDETFTLDAGSVFFIDCKDYQYYHTKSRDTPWEMDWIHFSGGNTGRFYQEFMRSGKNVFQVTGNPQENALHLIMQQLLKLQDHPNAKSEYQASVLIHQLLNELLLQKFQQDFTEEDIPAYILGMKDYLDTHFQKNITLDSLEHRFHLNKFQLNKEFSFYMGLPPIDYVISKKISYAKDLLRYTKENIQTISVDCGVDNPAYFSRLFKKKTGFSPSEYRKIN
ncbi:AraC family transcriptional regulator [Enterococcus nangangensis]|uniref:AraC family transcriptional regulator n=1 Tax=Enterococcus nangangensis TaxID=2559926 RepID=UPI0010F9BD73|nr:AraC family transcriptional regulator [Enterococcus nangangensis]